MKKFALKLSNLAIIILLLAVMCLPSTSTRAAGMWYAGPEGDDANSCNTPDLPCRSINAVLAKLDFLDGDTLFLRQGTYTADTGLEIALLNKSANILGGWDAEFASQPGWSTLDGSSAHRGMTVLAGVTARLERLVIQNNILNNLNQSYGAGINNAGTLTIVDSKVIQNQAGDGVTMVGYGGGIYNSGTLTVDHSIISDNYSLGGSVTDGYQTTGYLGVGAGIYNSETGNLTLTYCQITANHAGKDQYSGVGSGVFNAGTATVDHCTFKKNAANLNYTYADGALYNSSSGIMTVSQSEISENSLEGAGAGVYNAGNATILNSIVRKNVQAGVLNNGQMVVVGSTFSWNMHEGYQGGVGIQNESGNLSVDNSTFTQNESNGLLSNYGDLSVNNCTISGNTLGLGIGYGATINIRNNIIAGNTDADITAMNFRGTFTSEGYNIVEKGNSDWDGAKSPTDRSIDPQFGNFNLTPFEVHPLKSISPAIDAGNPDGCLDHAGNLITTDQMGQLRVGRCDIGAYEYNPEAPGYSESYLPILHRLQGGIFGKLTTNGQPVANFGLSLIRLSRIYGWEEMATTQTSADGTYGFTDIPDLPSWGIYVVFYSNPPNDTYLAWWESRFIPAYNAGMHIELETVDIANIPLVSPPGGSTVLLPVTFQWQPRPAVTWDNYDFNLYQLNSDNYVIRSYYTKPFGYTDQYKLAALPSGFAMNTWYLWYVGTYTPDGGYGVSYYSNYIKFVPALGTGKVESEVLGQIPNPVSPGKDGLQVHP